MATSDAGLRDAVQADLNPPPAQAGQVQVRRVPERPANSASTQAWLDYVVALGASVDVGKDTQHYDDSTGGYVTVPALTRGELTKLADSLTGRRR